MDDPRQSGAAGQTPEEPGGLPESDDQLVQLAVDGDDTALEKLLLRYYDRLLNYIRLQMPTSLARRVGPEDILQHTYLKAFRAITKFEPRGGYSFFSWLKRIADNERIDQLRKAGREPAGSVTPTPKDSDGSYFDMAGQIAGEDPTATLVARRKELVAVLQLTIARLKPEYRDAIELRYLKGLPFEEVARQMNMTDGQLRGLLHRARRQVKDEIRRLSHYV